MIASRTCRVRFWMPLNLLIGRSAPRIGAANNVLARSRAHCSEEGSASVTHIPPAVKTPLLKVPLREVVADAIENDPSDPNTPFPSNPVVPPFALRKLAVRY